MEVLKSFIGKVFLYPVSLPQFYRKIRMDTTQLLIKTIIKGIQEKKGHDIVVADLTEIDDTICNYLIICQGNSPAQIEAITESIGDFARTNAHAKPTAVDGLRNAQWVAMDYSDIIVHIFLPEPHDFYDLEHLWEDAKLTYIPDMD